MKERKMDKRFLFLVGLIVIIAILPFVYAASIEDIARQEIGANTVSYNIPGDVDAQKMLEETLKNNPELQTKIRNALTVIIILTVLLVIDIILKGFAMWKASKNNSKVWFWALLLLNTLGILPLLYLIFSKKQGLENKKK